MSHCEGKRKGEKVLGLRSSEMCGCVCERKRECVCEREIEMIGRLDRQAECAYKEDRQTKKSERNVLNLL